MNDAGQRIFLYLRVSSDGRELARTKIRELAGLASAMAELTGRLLALDPSAARENLQLDYVEAGTDEALITLSTDIVRLEQVIEGRIPAEYRDRLLDRPPTVDVDRYEERASRHLDQETRRELHERLRSPGLDVLGLIRSAIREDGTFAIRVPLVY